MVEEKDKKSESLYLKLIPYAWELIELRIKDDDIFQDLKKNLQKNFSKKNRLKK